MPQDTTGELRGQPLRYLLVKVLRQAGRPLTVQELIGRCTDEGVVFHDRASKVISDALRWERKAGRVRHLRRGLYAFGKAPRSTMYWITRRTRQTRYWLRWSKTQTEKRGEPPSPKASTGWAWNQRSSVPDWPWWPALS